jgi:hypothetical protein
MRRISFVLLLASACTPAAFYPSQPNTTHRLAELRTQGGACSHSWLADTHVETCARTGAPYTINDSQEPVLLTHLRAPTFPDADPSNWLVIVLGPDGKELLRRTHAKVVPEVGTCTEYGCTKWSISLLPVPAAWTPGTYKVRYVCTFDTRRVIDLSITLDDKALSNR